MKIIPKNIDIGKKLEYINDKDNDNRYQLKGDSILKGGIDYAIVNGPGGRAECD